jgi:hypothetical protein
MTSSFGDIHLYWAYDHAPHLLSSTRTGVSLCGYRGVPNNHLTNFPKFCTCQECLLIRKEYVKDKGKFITGKTKS